MDTYTMTDQPETCPKCGARSDFMEEAGIQSHRCLGCGEEWSLIQAPLHELRFTHNGSALYTLTIDVWSQYDLATETQGDYCAKIWANGDTVRIEYFPSEEAAICWFMRHTGATTIKAA